MKRLLTALAILMATASCTGIRKGEMLEFNMEGSSVYPGTFRTIQVYVPATYTGEEPACAMFMFDGVNYNSPDVIDELIAEGSMPVTIAVYIQPGRITAPDGTGIRFNRSNEFDGTDGKMAAFIENEVIPAVEALETSDGRAVRLSRNAADRALVGASSGGTAAFCAAWNRPDLFSRVYSVVGTYCPMRGADQLPGIIRKTEPKPIRIYLQDNMDDSWNPLFGSWFEYNSLMYSALRFAGYDVWAKWQDGGHSGQNGGLLFKGVMRWLWQGWPEPVRKGETGNETLQDILDPESDWEVFMEGAGTGTVLSPLSEDEVAMNAGDFDPRTAVYPGAGQVSCIADDARTVRNYIIDGAGNMTCGEDYYYLHAPARQITYDTAGYLYAATDIGVQICDHNGRVRAILSVPQGPVSSVAFAGERLFIVSGGTVLVRHLRRRGFTNPDAVPTPQREEQG